MVRVGPVPVRARLGRRARGLQRRRRRLELVPARPRPVARVPLERGRHGRHDRRLQPAVPGPRAVERQGPDPQGADVRAVRPEGNHGEDVKDYWWYLDAVPSSAWLRWRYHYPQAAFPYEDLSTTTAARSKFEPEYELLDTGVFDDDRYWIVEVHYAKASPTDILMRVVVRNRGPETATLHVLPTLWFRNEWAWNPEQVKPRAPRGRRRRGRSWRRHPELGDYTLEVGPAPDGTRPTLLFCENETNRRADRGRTRRRRRTRRTASTTTSSRGAATVNPDGDRDEGVAWYRLDVPAGETAELRLRLHRRPGRQAGTRCRRSVRARSSADSSAESRPPRRRGQRQGRGRRGAPSDRWAVLRVDDAPARGRGRRVLRGPSSRWHGPTRSTRVMRQAFAGMLWSKQYYGYNVARWLDGDPGLPPPPPERLTARNATLAALRLGRHPVDARSMGVPVVRRLGPRVPRGHPRPHRPGVREVPAAAAVPRMVPAPAWGAAGLRVVVRRRQPAGPRRAAYLVWTIDGRRDDEFLRADLPQAADELHVVAEPPGQARATTSSGAGSSASTTSARSTGRTCPPGRSSSSPTRRPGCSCTA